MTPECRPLHSWVRVSLFQTPQIKYLNDTTGRTCNKQRAFNSDGDEQRTCSVERRQSTSVPQSRYQIGRWRHFLGRVADEDAISRRQAPVRLRLRLPRSPSFSNSTRVVELRCGRFSAGWSGALGRRGFHVPSHAYVRSLGSPGRRVPKSNAALTGCVAPEPVSESLYRWNCRVVVVRSRGTARP